MTSVSAVSLSWSLNTMPTFRTRIINTWETQSNLHRYIWTQAPRRCWPDSARVPHQVPFSIHVHGFGFSSGVATLKGELATSVMRVRTEVMEAVKRIWGRGLERLLFLVLARFKFACKNVVLIDWCGDIDCNWSSEFGRLFEVWGLENDVVACSPFDRVLLKKWWERLGHGGKRVGGAIAYRIELGTLNWELLKYAVSKWSGVGKVRLRRDWLGWGPIWLWKIKM
jgi:hypothetical protein